MAKMMEGLKRRLASCKQRLSSDCFRRDLLLSLSASSALSSEYRSIPTDEEAPAVKVLLVVAHPDDESECSAAIYRITHEFGGVVDQVVVTNGEGGSQYSAPAQIYYRQQVTSDAWRKQLARIRRRELIESGRILGIRNHYFLKQTDTGVTRDADEALRAWDTASIQRDLSCLLRCERYDLVVVLLPSADTHGHHKTVALLTLQVIDSLPDQDRPAVLGARTSGGAETAPGTFLSLDGFPLTRAASPDPAWVFDRKTPMTCHRDLDYAIISNWVIAAHKSQGAFQMEFGRRNRECFWLFAVSGESGTTRWRNFINAFEPAEPLFGCCRSTFKLAS